MVTGQDGLRSSTRRVAAYNQDRVIGYKGLSRNLLHLRGILKNTTLIRKAWGEGASRQREWDEQRYGEKTVWGPFGAKGIAQLSWSRGCVSGREEE